MSPATTPYEVGRVRYLPLKYDSQDSESSALKLILTLVPEWGHGDSRVEFVRFTDGITNTLLKAVNRRPGLSKAEVDKEAILLRAYGNGTAILIDREREAANHELLMRHGLAPELLARFENGMLYRYITGEVATPQNLSEPLLIKAIARRLAEWHATVPCLHKVPPTNGKTNGTHRSDAADQNGNHSLSTISGKPSPNLWTTMQKWLLALPTETDQQRERQATLRQELTEMISKLGNRPGLGQNGVRTQTLSPHPFLIPNTTSLEPTREEGECFVENDGANVELPCSLCLPTVICSVPISSYTVTGASRR